VAAREALRLLAELQDRGWQRSVAEQLPVDGEGEPVPWMNYGAVSVLAGLVTPGTRVFEYGCGGSTAWLSRRTAHVHAVEHDPAWAERCRALVGPSTVDLRCIPCGGDWLEAPPDDAYVMAPLAGDGAVGPFDLVIVDGMARLPCLEVARRCVAAGGIVVLDDTERPAYAAARERLVADGFRELRVFGPKPTMGDFSATSFFVP